MDLKSVEVKFISDYSLGVFSLLKGSDTSSPSLSQVHSPSKQFAFKALRRTILYSNYSMHGIAGFSLAHKKYVLLSQDDYACVPIGITAANKQSPMIMHVYRVSLPGHDWVVAEQNNTIRICWY